MDRLHLSLESSGVNVLALLYLLRSNKPADKYLEMVVVQYCSRLQTRGIFFGILAFVGHRFLEYRTTCIHVKANLSFNIRAMYTTICQLQGVGGRGLRIALEEGCLPNRSILASRAARIRSLCSYSNTLYSKSLEVNISRLACLACLAGRSARELGFVDGRSELTAVLPCSVSRQG